MASALEHFVNTLTSLTSQGNHSETVKFMSKNQEILSKNVAHLDTVLATLQPAVHSLGVLAVLKVRLQHTLHTDCNIDTLHATVAEFINVCNEDQIRHAPDWMAELCGSYADLLVSGKCAMRGLEVLQTAIIKIRDSPYHLTSIHSHLVHLCLVSKCFKPAIKFLEVDVLDLSHENGHFKDKHFLLYYYYGGMIYTAVKKYTQAQYFFQICISTPAMAVSRIMLEAFKKYILISLLVDGKFGKISKYASPVIYRFIKPLSNAYLELGSAFLMNDPEKFNGVVNKHQEVFIRDQNMGLVKQCIHALYKMNIKRLTRTFLTLSLADVSHRVHLQSPQEAQKYILNMIEDGEIYASINQKDGMVVFLDNPEKYNSPEMMVNLDKELQICMDMERQLTAMEEEILVNPTYVQKVLLGSSEEEVGVGTSAGQMVASTSGSSTAFS